MQKLDGTPKSQVWTSVLGREVLKDKCCSLTSQMLNYESCAGLCVVPTPVVAFSSLEFVRRKARSFLTCQVASRSIFLARTA